MISACLIAEGIIMVPSYVGDAAMLTRRSLLSGATAIAFGRQAQAGSPVRLIVPYAAGGGVDLTARMLAEGMERHFGQTMVVDNRSGGGGVVAMQNLTQSAPDGQTLIVSTPSTVTIGPLLRPSPYDPLALTHVTRICTSPLLLVCRPSLPAADMAEFVALVRRSPTTLKLANSGPGTATQLAAEMFNLDFGDTRFLHVPYRGTAPAMADLINGTADAIFTDSSAWTNVEQGRVRLLAVTSPERWKRSPTTPTVSESLPGFVVLNWYGLAGPPAMSAATTARLAADVAATLTDQAVQRRLADIGFDVAPLSGTDFTDFLGRETAMWRELIQRANIRVE